MRAKTLLLFVAGMVLVWVMAGPAPARTWTNHEGKQIEAEYVRLDGLKVVLLMSGREVSVPLVNLSDADKRFVFEQQLGGASPKTADAAPAAAAESGATESAAEETDESEASSRSGSADRKKDDPASGVARIRTWKDNDGNTVRAKFIRIHQGNVILMQGRKTVPCPIEKLSAEDQDYLRQLLTARGEGHLMPSADQLASRQNMGEGGGYSAPTEESGYGAGYTPPQVAAAPYTIEQGAGAGGYSPAPTYTEPSGGAGGYTPYTPPTETGGYAGSGYNTDTSTSTAGAGGYTPYDISSASPTSTETSTSMHGETAMASATSSGYNPADMYNSTPSVTPPPMSTDTSYPSSGYESPLAQQMTYYCSSCNGIVPEHINDRCPHCGIRFDYVEQPDGSRKYNGRLWGGSIGGIIAVVIGVIVRLVIMAQRNA